MRYERQRPGYFAKWGMPDMPVYWASRVYFCQTERQRQRPGVFLSVRNIAGGRAFAISRLESEIVPRTGHKFLGFL